MNWMNEVSEMNGQTYFLVGSHEKFKTLCFYFAIPATTKSGRVVTQSQWLPLIISHVSLVIWLLDVT